MKTRVLILAEPGDVHTLAVVLALESKGVEVCTWYTSAFPSRSLESALFEGGKQEVLLGGISHSGVVHAEVDAVWRRRPSHILDEGLLHPADRKFAERECLAFRRSLLRVLSPDAFWVNPPDAAVGAGRKLVQHSVAVDCGLSMPDTLYSNDPQEIRSFLRRHGGEIAYKGLQGGSWHDQEKTWLLYTSVLREDQLVPDELLRLTPGIYQALVPKAYELGVTMMGRRAFAAKIRSQETQAGKLDWRKSYGELKMEPATLPGEVVGKCCALLDKLGLVFGCFDFIVTPQGEYVFLEVNEMGQFLFVEPACGLPLLDAFGEFLFQGRVDFEWDEDRVGIRYPEIREEALARAALEADLYPVPPERSSYEGVPASTPAG